MRIAAIAVTAMLGLGAGFAHASEDLAKANGCLGCHAADQKKVGPSFKSIAAKYKGKADAEASLVAKLGDAKKHPANKASPEDRAALVKWILAM